VAGESLCSRLEGSTIPFDQRPKSGDGSLLMNIDRGGAVALITGANRGLGLEVARQLGARGTTVLLGARDEVHGRLAADGLTAAGIDATYLPLDVADDASVKNAAHWIGERFGRLDILVNNAALLLDRVPTMEVTGDLMRQTYEVNVFGVVRVTGAVVELLRAAPRARVVNLSSGLGSIDLNTRETEAMVPFRFLAYNSSKTAVNAITVMYANALAGTGIKVNAVDPGPMYTRMNPREALPSVAHGARIVVDLATVGDDGPSGAFLAEDGPRPW
jgi:NAD(P)-dependent dehydrogenase (short-subunit alcohol dehydrogenase family)